MLDTLLHTLTSFPHGLVWDALVVAAIFAGSVVFAFTLGRNSIMVSFVAVVFAGLMVQFLPSTAQLDILQGYSSSQIHVALFILASIVFGFIFRRNRFFEPYIVPTGFERMVFACLLAGLIVVILGAFWQGDAASPYVSEIFLNPMARLAWILAPVLILAIFRGNKA